jgi:hypothetical protein
MTRTHQENVKILTETLTAKICVMSVRERTAFLDGLLLTLNLANSIEPGIVSDEENFGMASALAMGLIAEAVEPIIQYYGEPNR